jgi:hypothetical protein
MEGRSRHGSVAVGDRLYVFGGKTQQSVLADLLEFNTKDSTWTSLPISGPSARFDFSFTLCSNQIVLVGGQEHSRRLCGDIWYLDLGMERRRVDKSVSCTYLCADHAKWKFIDAVSSSSSSAADVAMPFAHGAVAIASRLYIIGGHNGIGWTSQVILFDTGLR